MRQDVSHKQHLRVEMYGSDQPVFVAANVEHVEVSALDRNQVHACEGSFQYGQVLKVSFFNQLPPRV